MAAAVLAAGVSGSARVNPALGRPLMVARGDGARLVDLDGRTYLDFHMGFGSTLLGHNHPAVRRGIEAVYAASARTLELRDFYSIAREVIGYYAYLIR